MPNERPPDLSLFLDILHTLEDIGAPYMIIGAFAAIQYGTTRVTYDIDIVVDLSEEHIEALTATYPPPRYYADPVQMRDSIRMGIMFNIIDTSWPLDELLANREAFATFVREQWRAYVQQQTGQLLGEEPVRYLLSFETDHRLQDAVPGLLRSGTLKPVSVEQPDRLPTWARLAVLAPDEDRRPRRAAELLSILTEHLDTSLRPSSGQALPDARWEQWQAVARAWAELTALRYDPDNPLSSVQRKQYQHLQSKFDAAFLTWLRRRYAPLGSQRLPTPHHVHHVPHYIAFQRRRGQANRVALLILDCMALECVLEVM